MGIKAVASERLQYHVPRPSDGLDLNAWLAQLDPGVTAVLRPGVYERDERLVIPEQRHLTGQAPGTTGASTIRQATGAAITGGIVVTEAWEDDHPHVGDPVYISNIKIDGNRANCPSSTASGLIIMNYWSTIADVYVTQVAEDGITLRDTGRLGTVIDNSASENRVRDCKVHGVGRHAFFLQCQNNISNQDGFITNFLGSDCLDFMRFERISGWLVDRCHGYTIRRNGIVGQNAFASVVRNCEIEDFGMENTPGAFYSGITLTQLNGRSSHAMGNFVGMTEPAGTATFQAISITAGVNQTTARVTALGNELIGAGTARGRGLVAQVQSGGALALKLGGTAPGINQVSNVNTPSFVGAGVTVT